MVPLPKGFAVDVRKSAYGEYVVFLDAPNVMGPDDARILSVHLWSAHNECNSKNARAREERDRDERVKKSAKKKASGR